MKHFLMTIAFAVASLTTIPAIAHDNTPNDHSGPSDPATLVRPAYNLADAGESMARGTYNYYNISAAANEMHMKASALYRAARRVGPLGPTNGVTPEDHSDGGLDELFDAITDSYYRLQVMVRNSSDYRVRNYMQAVDLRYQDLALAFGG